MQKLKSYLLVFISLITLLFAPLVFAKSITLYDEPNTSAKVVGSVEIADGIIPIIKSKDETWIKVGDRKTGKVGWIQLNDLQNAMMLPVPMPPSQVKPASSSNVFDFNKLIPTPEQIQEQGKQGPPNFMQNLFNTINQVYQQNLQEKGLPQNQVPFGILANPPREPSNAAPSSAPPSGVQQQQPQQPTPVK